MRQARQCIRLPENHVIILIHRGFIVFFFLSISADDNTIRTNARTHARITVKKKTELVPQLQLQSTERARARARQNSINTFARRWFRKAVAIIAPIEDARETSTPTEFNGGYVMAEPRRRSTTVKEIQRYPSG